MPSILCYSLPTASGGEGEADADTGTTAENGADELDVDKSWKMSRASSVRDGAGMSVETEVLSSSSGAAPPPAALAGATWSV